MVSNWVHLECIAETSGYTKVTNYIQAKRCSDRAIELVFTKGYVTPRTDKLIRKWPKIDIQNGLDFLLE